MGLLGPKPISDRNARASLAALDFSARAGADLFFRVLFAIFQIKGLIGPNGILPAGDYLQAVAARHSTQSILVRADAVLVRLERSCADAGLLGGTDRIIARGLQYLAARVRSLICFVCFLSFVSAAQDFSGYQSDGMLLEAGFIALFFAPPGFRPGLGARTRPRARACFLLQWEWFRIYFESGVVKICERRSGVAPFHRDGRLLPERPAAHLDRLVRAATAALVSCSAVFYTFAAELVIVWMLFLPRRFRIACFCIVTPFQIGIILTANYAFLNYMVLVAGVLLLDDRFIEWILPQRIRELIEAKAALRPLRIAFRQSQRDAESWRAVLAERLDASCARSFAGFLPRTDLLRDHAAAYCGCLCPGFRCREAPVHALEPFRIANRYGLFAVMTHARYEIEFQGSTDGKTWIAYPFRYKPQDIDKAPGIYAPYQPRFDWNLWFASLGTWHEYRFVVWTEERLLKNEPDVLQLFAGNPFANAPPRASARRDLPVLVHGHEDEARNRDNGGGAKCWANMRRRWNASPMAKSRFWICRPSERAA